MKLIVHSATPKHLSRSANSRHLKTGKSENNLCLCGKLWPNSSKFSSLKVMAQVPSLSLRSTPVHKFSASRIEETALENQCSNLPSGSGQLFALVAPDLCVSGVPCEVLQLSSQHGQCVMAAPSPPRFLAAWQVEAPFPAVFVSDGFYVFAISLTRCLTVQDVVPCSREDPLHEFVAHVKIFPMNVIILVIRGCASSLTAL